MYLADYHTHSDCSPDGDETIARMAEAALAHGLDEICITDHMDTIYWGSKAPRWDFDWPKALAELEEEQAAEPAAQTLLTEEEIKEITEKVKAELTEELKQNAGV